MEFFSHCPGCGRRFHIILESKKPVTMHRESIQGPPERLVASKWGAAIDLLEGRPVIVDVEEFQYTYRCMHCGHEWSEKHFEKHVEPDQDS